MLNTTYRQNLREENICIAPFLKLFKSKPVKNTYKKLYRNKWVGQSDEAKIACDSSTTAQK